MENCRNNTRTIGFMKILRGQDEQLTSEEREIVESDINETLDMIEETDKLLKELRELSTDSTILNEMKTKYATNEWICLFRRTDSYEHLKAWTINNSPTFNTKFKWVLVHKKHSDILDHLLGGEKVRCIQEFEIPPTIYQYTLDTFLSTYDVDFFYEVIMFTPASIGNRLNTYQEQREAVKKLAAGNYPIEPSLHGIIVALYKDIVDMHPSDGLSSPRDIKLVTEINKKRAMLDHLQNAMRVVNPHYTFEG